MTSWSFTISKICTAAIVGGGCLGFVYLYARWGGFGLTHTQGDLAYIAWDLFYANDARVLIFTAHSGGRRMEKKRARERKRRNTSVLISYKTNIWNGGCMQSERAERGISNMPPAPFLMASTSASFQMRGGLHNVHAYIYTYVYKTKQRRLCIVGDRPQFEPKFHLRIMRWVAETVQSHQVKR